MMVFVWVNGTILINECVISIGYNIIPFDPSQLFAINQPGID